MCTPQSVPGITLPQVWCQAHITWYTDSKPGCIHALETPRPLAENVHCRYILQAVCLQIRCTILIKTGTSHRPLYFMREVYAVGYRPYSLSHRPSSGVQQMSPCKGHAHHKSYFPHPVWQNLPGPVVQMLAEKSTYNGWDGSETDTARNTHTAVTTSNVFCLDNKQHHTWMLLSQWMPLRWIPTRHIPHTFGDTMSTNYKYSYYVWSTQIFKLMWHPHLYYQSLLLTVVGMTRQWLLNHP